MSEDAATTDKPAPPPAARPAGKLKTWERWVAGGFGLAGVGVGGAGVFLSDNQAGTTAILLLGAVFVLLAVQGTTILKASTDGIEVSAREAERQVVEGAQERLETKGSDEAAAFIEGATARDPELAATPGMQQLSAQVYERQVQEALRRVVGTLGFPAEVENNVRLDNREYDAVVRRPDGRCVVVEVKFITSDKFARMRLQDALGRLVTSRHPGLVVSNRHPTRLPSDLNAISFREGTSLRLVGWESSEDDRELTRVLHDLLALDE